MSILPEGTIMTDSRIIFTYDEELRKWTVSAEGMTSAYEAGQAFNAVVVSILSSVIDTSRTHEWLASRKKDSFTMSKTHVQS
jgi:hypothetical protein